MVRKHIAKKTHQDHRVRKTMKAVAKQMQTKFPMRSPTYEDTKTRLNSLTARLKEKYQNWRDSKNIETPAIMPEPVAEMAPRRKRRGTRKIIRKTMRKTK